MNKKELEGKVVDIQQKLAALGDLNTLVQSGTQLPALITQAQTASTTAQAFLPQLETQQQTLKTLIE